jgi:membrane protease subunit HflK
MDKTPDPSHPEHAAPGGGEPFSDSVQDAGSQALSEALRSSFTIVKFVMVILIVVFFASGVFTVPSGGSALILRLGKPVGVAERRLLGPGLHWAFPYPIDEIVHIPGGQLHTVRSSVGWYATTPELEANNQEPEAGLSLNPATEGFTLTADGNIIHVRSTLRYRITDPIRYAFNFANGTNANLFAGASNLVQNALNNALFHTSAHYTVDKALVDRTGFKEKVLTRVDQLVTDQNLGITVESADLELKAPRQVKAVFDQVTEAQQNAVNARDTARGYAKEITSKAEGEAAALISGGIVASNQTVQAVFAETTYLTGQLPSYRRNPEFYLQRMQTESIHRALTNAQEKYISLEPSSGRAREFRLQLSREPQKPTAKQAEKSDEAPITRDTRRR